MKTVVYVDVLLLVNFVVGYILIEATSFLLGLHPSFAPKAGAAALSAVSSLCILLPPWPLPVQLAGRAAVGLAMAAVAFRPRTARAAVRQTACLFALNTLLAGVVVLLSLRGVPGMHTNNLACYFYLSPWLLTGCVTGVYVVLRLLMLLSAPHGAALRPCTIVIQGQPLRLTVFLDTGFLLSDPLEGLPVLLLSWPAVQQRLPEPLRGFLRGWFSGQTAPPPQGLAVRMLPCRTSAGAGLFPAVTATGGDGRCRVLAAFCGEKLKMEGADAIRGSAFPTELCEQGGEHEFFRRSGKCNSSAGRTVSAAGRSLLHQRSGNTAAAFGGGGGKNRFSGVERGQAELP